MQNTGRKNVIWLFGDQHRAQATGYNGDPNCSTPNMDRLAAEGVTFPNAVAGCPLCCPFRGSLLSGQYPHRSVPGHEHRLPEDQLTVADVFNDHGYHTAYFGKWHLDGFHEKEGRGAMHIVPPHRRGRFKQWLGYENNNSPFDSWVHGGEGGSAVHYRLDGYETDVLTDLFIAHLEQRAREQLPFFSVLSVQPPHNPYIAPESWMRRHSPASVRLRPNVPDIERITTQARRGLAGVYAQIENLDWNIGRVRDALARLNLADTTHILFFSDHGDMHGSHGQFLKTSPWEEAVRVPFIIGGTVPFYGTRGGSTPAPINHVDIGPTTLGLCGIDAPKEMPGTDYSGYRIPGRTIQNEPDSALMQLVKPTMHADSTDRPWRGIVTRDRWKYVVLEGQPWLLFNLNEDPYELANLAHNSRYHAERHRLQERLRDWIAHTGDNFRLPE